VHDQAGGFELLGDAVGEHPVGVEVHRGAGQSHAGTLVLHETTHVIHARCRGPWAETVGREVFAEGPATWLSALIARGSVSWAIYGSLIDRLAGAVSSPVQLLTWEEH